MDNIAVTPQAERALQMAKIVMNGRRYSRVGQITGEPGTGKSTTTRWLAQQLGGVRIEAWAGMAEKHMLQELASAYDAQFGTSMILAGTANTLFQRLVHEGLDGKLIIVDEANHLKWRSLEVLRGLSDRGAGVILSGTDLLTRTLTHPQVRIFLEQLRQRIGAKKVVMQAITDPDELAAYVLAPRFPSLTRAGAKAFFHASGGNWRAALELADACERLMQNEGWSKFDETVVQTAAAWMAGAQ